MKEGCAARACACGGHQQFARVGLGVQVDVVVAVPAGQGRAVGLVAPDDLVAAASGGSARNAAVSSWNRRMTQIVPPASGPSAIQTFVVELVAESVVG